MLTGVLVGPCRSNLTPLDSGARSATVPFAVPLRPSEFTALVADTYTTNSCLGPTFAWPHSLAYRGPEHICIITAAACAMRTGSKLSSDSGVRRANMIEHVRNGILD